VPATYADLLRRLGQLHRAGVDLGLDRIRAVLAALGDPQQRVVTVHIAGTNGKGSTAAMTDAILRAAGMRSGLYTSPHLSRFTERIRVDGREADGDRLAVLAERVAAASDALGVPLTYFEVATVLAFLAFAEARVDVAVLETGLGGRLDATTVCEPVATAITSIGLDHAEFLGGTLPEIAREKAGIAKRGIPLFLAPLPGDAEAAIVERAASIGAPVLHFGSAFAEPSGRLALAGPHQRTNAALAAALARRAAEACGRTLVEAQVAAGLAGVTWPGRMEWLGEDLLLDCAHNPQGAAVLAEAVGRTPGRPRALVFSAVAGKAVADMLAALTPQFDFVVATRSSSERALPAGEIARLASAASGQGRPVSQVADPMAAVVEARTLVGPGGLVVVAGSTFLVGDVRAAVLGEVRDPLRTSDPAARPAPASQAARRS
jgi:dihydrofolate synthase/folylpolyglutamate synthase